MRPLYEDSYCSVSVDFGAERIEMIRTGIPFQGLRAMLGSLEGFMTAVRDAQSTHFVLLVDSTEAPSPQGPEYKKGIFTWARFLASNFERIAVVVSSREAALQELEVVPSDNIDFFTNRAAARNALTEPSLHRSGT